MTVVRMVTIKMKPGTFDEALRLFREQTMPAARALPGSTGMDVFTDAANSLGIVLNFFESPAAVEADRAAFPERFAIYQDLLAEPPTVQLLEVSAQA